MNTTPITDFTVNATSSTSEPGSVMNMDAYMPPPTSVAFKKAANAIDMQNSMDGPLPMATGKTNVFDVAAYILEKCGELSALKLQKLVYYCQAWSLVWDGEPLFPERIEAWAYGPVVKELYEYHRGLFSLSSLPIGSSFKLSATQKETIDAVIKYYGGKTPLQLIDLTHHEDPWKNARQGVPVGAPSSREITLEAMAEYYSSL